LRLRRGLPISSVRHMTQTGIDLFLLGSKGEAVLKQILDKHGTEAISAVTAARDAGVDDDRFDGIRAIAEVAKVPFFVRDPSDRAARAAIAVGWRWLIKRDYVPLIVLHDSLLPKYRGFNSLVSCLINREPQIGVTALIANIEYDRGPVLAQRTVQIEHPMRIADAIACLLPLYADIASEIVANLQNGTAMTGQPQEEADATYSLWRDQEDYQICWDWDAERIHRFILAVGSPYAGARCTVNGRAARIIDAKIVEDVRVENRTPGKVIFLNDGIPTIVCGQGLLRVLQAKYEGDQSPVVPLKRLRSRFG
jgi:methionyl-tRNA formyltransferase